MLLHPPGHSITWRPILNSDYSIEVPAHVEAGGQSDDERDVVLAFFKCPYCWEEGYFIEEIRNGERLAIVCERTQREFAIRFDLRDKTARRGV
jgi:hypothetical protein